MEAPENHKFSLSVLRENCNLERWSNVSEISLLKDLIGKCLSYILLSVRADVMTHSLKTISLADMNLLMPDLQQ